MGVVRWEGLDGSGPMGVGRGGWGDSGGIWGWGDGGGEIVVGYGGGEIVVGYGGGEKGV